MTNREAKGILVGLEAGYRDLNPLALTDDGIRIVNERIEAVEVAISALKTQDVPKTNVGDTISRQAAIDALIKWYGCEPTDIGAFENIIEKLPSAQPELHTCVNCGRTVNNGGWYADGGTRCPIEEHYALPKDGYCHLWEKRNVTDDDYPERRTDE